MRFADPSNSKQPFDLDEDRTYVERQVAAVVSANGTSEDAEGYAEAVGSILFPDVLPFIVAPARSTATRTTMGVALPGTPPRR